MRIKTSEVSRSALDFLVAKCEGHDIRGIRKGGVRIVEFDGFGLFSPSKWWSDGGPIKTRERISTIIKRDGRWVAIIFDPNDEPTYTMLADDELTAAMRCYVASKLGEYVDVPDEVQS